MNLTVIGSGSDGNCYALDDGKQILIIECGLPLMEAKRGIRYQVSRIKGCVVSHRHGDHAGYTSQYRKMGLPIFEPYLHTEDGDFQRIQYGDYDIQAFPLVHDVPCYGFLIRHPYMGTVLYASDTAYIRYRFKNLDHIIIEANYSIDFMSDDLLDTPKRNHVLYGHMELGTAQRFLQLNGKDAKNIILAHLSADNSNRDQFLIRTQPLVEAPVWIAQKGLRISL